MIKLNNQIKYTIFIYLIISIYIWIQKPQIIFQQNKLKAFGIGNNKTIFYYPLLLIILAIFCYSLMLNFKIN